jgi:hypothetical protein
VSITITGWNFFLKKWWVQWKLRQLQPQWQLQSSVATFVVSQEDEDREKLQTLVKDEEVQ